MEDYLEKGPSSGFSSYPYPLLAALILIRILSVPLQTNGQRLEGWEGGALTILVS